jgi:formylmethanofuran:tetrahydromethanopterin formyltransferase
MEINGVEIQDTFAEAFGIQVSRLLVTAATKKLAKIAATEATGYGTSVTAAQPKQELTVTSHQKKPLTADPVTSS